MGECNGCAGSDRAGCCDPVQLVFTQDQLRAVGPSAMDSYRDYQWVLEDLTRIPYREGLARAPHLNQGGITMGLDMAGDMVMMHPVFYECRWYDRDNKRCLNYENRPKVCADYPWYMAACRTQRRPSRSTAPTSKTSPYSSDPRTDDPPLREESPMPTTIPHTTGLQPAKLRTPAHEIAWYTPHGWTYLSKEQATARQAAANARFSAAARVAHVHRQATKVPTRWPRKHLPLLLHLRELADERGWTWSWNDTKKNIGDVQAGALLLVHPHGTEHLYLSLDEASTALCATTSTAKRTAKGELVSFLRRVSASLPVEHQAEAHRLLEAA